jgi:hypothetical protein
MSYDVGYRKPPVHYRFKKGKSGNPKGRPKGRMTSRDLDKAFDKVVTIQEDGKKRRVRLRTLIAKRFAAAAARGDWKFLNKAIDYLRLQDDRTAIENAKPKLEKIIVEFVSPDGTKKILE